MHSLYDKSITTIQETCLYLLWILVELIIIKEKENKQSVEEETNRDLSQAGVLGQTELSKALCTYQETSQAAI